MRTGREVRGVYVEGDYTCLALSPSVLAFRVVECGECSERVSGKEEPRQEGWVGVEWCQEAGDCAEWLGAEPCTDKPFVIKIYIVCCKECRFWSLVIFPSSSRWKVIKQLEAELHLSKVAVGLDKLAGKTWCWYFLVGVNYVSLECGKSPGHLDLPGWSGDNSGWVPAVTARYTLWSHWQVGCRTGLPAATPSWKCSRLEPGWTSESGAVASCLLFWDLLQTHHVIHDLSNHHFD